MPRCLIPRFDGAILSLEYLLETEAPIARLKPAGWSDEVRLGYGSHRRKWENVDDMGGCVLPLDQTLDHLANNSVFWTWT